MKKIKIDLFSDVVCGWCYVLSETLETLSKEFELDIAYHSFALGKTREDMNKMFGNSQNAKKEIMLHWERTKTHAKNLIINVEKMRENDFLYPTSLPGLKACQAAKLKGGQKKYKEYFNKIQYYHLTLTENIADEKILIEVAQKVGLDIERFTKDLRSEKTTQMVDKDIELSRKLGISSVPSMIVNDTLISGARNVEYFRDVFNRL